MPLSYRNIIDTNQLSDALTTSDFSKVVKKKNNNIAKYVKGYADQSAIEALANGLSPNTDMNTFRKLFGIENKELDGYDPYNTTDAKKEEFWYANDNKTSIDGRSVQTQYDEDTNTFKRGLYSQYGFRDSDFLYEDPFIPSFELFFDNDSPFFSIENKENGFQSFIAKYNTVSNGYSARLKIWKEFQNVFFKIFEKKISYDQRNLKNKAYYITKIAGLEFLNKKMTSYGEDKITITLNEDIAMFSWYLAELYNNIAYNYREQKYMFPENVLRFNMLIKINDMRNYQMPQNNNLNSEHVPKDSNNIQNGDIKNVISPKSQIVYELRDCNFNFFESKNYDNEIEIGGYNSSSNYTPRTLSFDIFFKSVTRYSNFPLLTNYPKIDAWADSFSPELGLLLQQSGFGTANLPVQSNIFTDKFTSGKNDGTTHNFYDDLDRIKEKPPAVKGYLNKLITKAGQTIVNAGVNYIDNLETSLREVRGSAVNSLLQQFRNKSNINKIEPDNIYNPDFNNRNSLKNFGKQVASGLLNELESNVKNAANF